jgi:hypothetical protein
MHVSLHVLKVGLFWKSLHDADQAGLAALQITRIGAIFRSVKTFSVLVEVVLS